MEKINIDNITKFNNMAEAFNYIEILGGTKMELEDVEKEGKDVCDYTYYALDKMTLVFDKEFNTIRFFPDYPLVKTDFDDNLISAEGIINTSPFRDCFDGNTIFCLEGLVYLHSLVNHGDIRIEDYYRETIYDALSDVLNKAHKLSINDKPHVKTTHSGYVVNSFFKQLDRLKKSIMPLKGNLHHDFLIDKTVFNSTGVHQDKVDKRMHFDYEWKVRDDNTLKCEYHQSDSYQTYIMTEDTDRHYYLKYTVSNNMETLKFSEENEGEINITRGTYVKNNTLHELDWVDYIEFTRIINSFCYKIWDRLPLIKDQIERDEMNIESYSMNNRKK